MRPTIVLSPLLLLAALLCCLGCEDSEKPEETLRPFAGETITVSFPADLGFEREWELALAEWKERTGADVELRPRQINYGDQSLLDAYGGSVAEAGDLILFPVTGTAQLGEARFFPVIPEDRLGSAGLNWQDLFKSLRESVGSRYGGPTEVPISCPVLTCYYREDLLNAAKLSPPQTWEEYQKLVETVDVWAGGLPVVEPWGGEFRATMFLARAVSYVKHPNEYSTFFDIRSGNPLVDQPGYQRALADAMKAVKAMPEAVLTYDTVDCRQEFFAGRAAMAITFETGVGNPIPALVPCREHNPDALLVEERPEGMQIGFAQLPGSSEVYHHTNNEWVAGNRNGVNRVALAGFGGLSAAVSARSSEVKTSAAWNLFEFLTDNEQFAQTFPPRTRTLCRTSEMSFPEVWLPTDITAAEGGSYLGEVSRTLDNGAIVVELPVVKRELFRGALSEVLGELFVNQVTQEDALRLVAERWRKISQEVGVEKVRDSYRSSLGLRPLSSKDEHRSTRLR